MSNREKYDAAFMEVFEIRADQLNSTLEYQSITAWDSVGHWRWLPRLKKSLISCLKWMISLILTYETGIKTMEKYGGVILDVLAVSTWRCR